MHLIGVTGTIGSGKSTVGHILEKHGVPVIDSDKVVHELFENSAALQEALRERFGNEIFSELCGKTVVDRSKLAAIVFSDRNARADLEAIVHPATIEELDRRIASYSNEAIVAVLIPLLFEAGLEKHYDEIWAITADDKTLKERLRQRDSLSDAEIERRLLAQLSQEEKRKRANCAIDNSGTTANTELQVVDLLSKSKKGPR